MAMTDIADVKPCSNPGCDQPGTKSCSACYSSAYCCVSCQTANWPKHKEECDGHLRKVGKANIAKAKGFDRERNFVQALHHGEIAAAKLKKLKDRRLETVELIDDAMRCHYNALLFQGRYKECKECAEERYTLWAMNQMRNSGSIYASFALIQSCIQNKEFEDAHNYARHAMFMINDMADNFIPSDQQPHFLAEASYFLATAILRFTESGGILPEGKQKAGEEAIPLARQALELHKQVSGTESNAVASDMGILASALGYFNDVDDDEVLCLFEEAIAMYSRVEGSTSPNVAIGTHKLAFEYARRANRAEAANDLDRCIANYELSQPHLAEASRIYSAINHTDGATSALSNFARNERHIRRIQIRKEAAAAAAAVATG